MKGEKGFALVITLIVTALLVALVAQFVNETYVATSQSHNFVASQQASLLSESGATATRTLISSLVGTGKNTTSAQDPWATIPPLEDETGTLKVTVEEESGKLNLNAIADPIAVNATYYPMAQRLFQKLGLPVELVDAIADWIENADAPPQRNGAKTPYYNTLKPSYDAKGGKLDTLEELELIKGFTPQVIKKLKPYVTVYPKQGTGSLINLNTAQPELIAVLDEKISASDVSRILENRKTQPPTNLSEAGLGTHSNLTSVMNYKGDCFRIRSEAKVGESVSITEAVIKVNGSSSDILYWRQY